MIRVILPTHLKTLARIDGEIKLNVKGKATVRTVLDALEQQFPMLTGTIRDHDAQKRRPMVRFFVCQEDISLESPDEALPSAIVEGKEVFMIVGSVAGG
jgi:molybdopterin synthase sulfur carrier subunit